MLEPTMRTETLTSVNMLNELSKSATELKVIREIIEEELLDVDKTLESSNTKEEPLEVQNSLHESTKVDIELLVAKETLEPSNIKEEPLEFENSLHVSRKVGTELLDVDKMLEPSNIKEEPLEVQNSLHESTKVDI